MLSVILLSNLISTTLYFKCECAFDLWQQLKLAFELEPDLQVSWAGAGSGLLTIMLEKLQLFHFSVVLLKMDGFAIDENGQVVFHF